MVSLRLGVLYLMFRRLVRHGLRREWFFGLLVFELLLGFTGYFAGFREPMVLAALALLEVFRPRSAEHWVRLAAIGALVAFAGLLWMGIRTVYRAEIDSGVLSSSRADRLSRIGSLSMEWVAESESVAQDVDMLVERMWAIYYPALAVARVPDVLPHEDGSIMLAALKHIVTPRILFPEKGILPSDSEMVRKYSGVYVASTEQNTSIAFGYAAESYVDFGIPIMFAPALAFGAFMGFAYRYLFRFFEFRELSVGCTSVVFWLALYLFERSWIKTLGTSLTLMIFVGGLMLVVDRALAGQRNRSKPARRHVPAVRRA